MNSLTALKLKQLAVKSLKKKPLQKLNQLNNFSLI
jgi:hypothetical protein